ncbi:MAG: MFS transporter [Dehalobacterium sp.]
MLIQNHAEAELFSRNKILHLRGFLLICSINLFIYLSFHMLTPTFPFFIKWLGGTEKTVGLITGAFSLAALLVRPVIGWLLDHVSRRIFMLVGISVMTVICFLYPWITFIPLLFILRVLHGINWANSGTSIATNAYDIIPSDRFTEGVSYFGIVCTLAMAIAPAVGMSLMNQYGFFCLFIGAALLNLSALVLAWAFHCKNSSPKLASGEKESLRYAFCHMFNRKALPAASLLLLQMIPYGAVNTFIALYAVEMKIAGSSMYFSFFAGAAMLSRLFCSRLADQKGDSFVVYCGLVCYTVAVLLIVFSSGAALLLLAGIFSGIAIGIVVPVMQSLALHRVPAERRGSASSTYLCFSDMGIGIGGIAGGYLAMYLGYRMMFACMLLPLAAAAWFYWGMIVGKKKQGDGSTA